MPTEFDNLESLINSLAHAAEMADRVSSNIARADELRRDLLVKAAEKSNLLLEEARKAAEAADDADLKKFLTSVTGIVGHLHQVAQEEAPADAENLSEPQAIFKQLTTSFRTHIQPMLDKIDPEGPNKKQIAMLGNVAGLATKTLAVGGKMIGYSDQMDTEERIQAVLGTVLMVAAVGILIAATVNPVTGPAVIAVTLAAFTLHAMGFHLAKKSIQRHVAANEPDAEELDHELDETHDQSAAMANDYIADNRSRRTMRFAEPAEGEALPQPDNSPSLVSRIARFFDFMRPK